MCKADSLPPSCAVMKSGTLNFLEPFGSLRACNGTDVPLPFTAMLCLYIHCMPCNIILVSPNWSVCSTYAHQCHLCIFLFPHACQMTCPSLFDLITQITFGVACKSRSSLSCNYVLPPVIFSFVGSDALPSTLFLNTFAIFTPLL